MSKLQYCDICSCPTGRCEEDSLYTDGQPYRYLCEDCYDELVDENGELRNVEEGDAV